MSNIKWFIAAAFIVSVMQIQAATYTIDPVHSTIGFSVRHMVVANVKGSFGSFSGTINYDAAAPENTSASAVIQVSSINTANSDRDDHLRNPDFFDVEQFPEITFETTGAQGAAPNITLVGNLTMKGVTKEIRLPVEISGPVKNMRGSHVIGLSGATEINRQDFGVTWSKTLDGGGLVVGDIVRIMIEVEAVEVGE